MRAEIRLAKGEVREEVTKAGKAGGFLGGAAVCGFLAAACSVTAGIAALALAMPLWLAGLLMALFLVCIGGALYYGGRTRMKDIDPVPERTVQTLRENLQWARHRTI
jgi:hypothetical protein